MDRFLLLCLTVMAAAALPGAGGLPPAAPSAVTPSGQAPPTQPPGAGAGLRPASPGAPRPASPGVDCQAIARWDVVPYQTFTAGFSIGVVAFHIAGIDRVEFTVEGGPPVSVTEVTRNPDSNVWEYTLALRAWEYRPGPVRVNAVAYPRVGTPRTLETLVLNADPAGTALGGATRYASETGDDFFGDGSRGAPFRTIARAAAAAQASSSSRTADHCRVVLLAGDYALGTSGRDQYGNLVEDPITRDGFLTVEADGGLVPSQVRLTDSGPGGLRTARLRLRHVTVYRTNINNSGSWPLPVIWFDGCTFSTGDRVSDIKWAQTTDWSGGLYITDSNVTLARWGFVGATLVRNTSLSQIGHDGFDNCSMLVNVSVDDLAVPEGNTWHPDVLQYWASETPLDNIIIYGLRATRCQSQGFLFGYTMHEAGPAWRNIAMVNTMIEASLTAQWCVTAHHVLWWHVTLPTSLAYLRDNPASGGAPASSTSISSVDVRNCVFRRLYVTLTGSVPRTADTAWATNNHFIDTSSGDTPGTAWTRGWTPTDLFNNPAGHDYRPRSGSVISARTSDRRCMVDAANTPLPTPAAVGALQGGGGLSEGQGGAGTPGGGAPGGGTGGVPGGGT